MKKKERETYLARAYLDSQRLKDTFFSAPKQEIKKTSPAKQIILFSFTTATIFACAFFFLQYDLVVIPRQTEAAINDDISLIHKEEISSLKYIGITEDMTKKKDSSLYLKIPSLKKTGLKIDFTRPIDLTEYSLILSMKKIDKPVKIGIILKDSSFRSNSQKPIFIELSNKNNQSQIEIPLEINSKDLENTNLYKINQLNLFFSPTKKINSNWILINDLFLAKKEGS